MTLFDPPGLAAALSPTERPRLLQVEVPGKPRGQGSMTLWTDKRTGGERAKYGAETVDHRNLTISTLLDGWLGRPPIDGPVAVHALAEFTRPASHYGTGRNRRQLKDSAPAEWFVGFPDADKVARLIGDALKIAGVLPDDRFIAEWRVRKRWSTRDCTSIEVFGL